ncbi:hypothetical protein SCP_0102290 [Sparassis crispa]|uniref:Uncharacterized protein n=1 Tax=Sparassis crispa TaxID=139825 RepID=A0A401G5B0_9APHY|nr:hypothetical protein SCP_0102290 [Sparassis crispa]GBE77356.1 hypothetical protein SCP_0102290 [Sparassis crispa]
MQPKVGNPQVYDDGDQRRNAPRGADAPAPFEAGKRNAHDIHDPKDNRTLGNRQKQEEKAEHDRDLELESHTVTDPLEPAQSQGHKPSRGAQVDAELQQEDEEMLKKKGCPKDTS